MHLLDAPVFIDFASSRFFHTAPFFTSGAVILGIVRLLYVGLAYAVKVEMKCGARVIDAPL